jgi:hypothetical protein
MLVLSINVVAQTYTAITSRFSYAFWDEKIQEWTPWQREVAEIEINIDPRNHTITIHSNKKQVYTLTNTESQGYDAEGDYVTRFASVDDKGVKCTITVMRRYSTDNSEQLYIQYSELAIVYTYTLIR